MRIILSRKHKIKKDTLTNFKTKLTKFKFEFKILSLLIKFNIHKKILF